MIVSLQNIDTVVVAHVISLLLQNDAPLTAKCVHGGCAIIRSFAIPMMSITSPFDSKAVPALR